MRRLSLTLLLAGLASCAEAPLAASRAVVPPRAPAAVVPPATEPAIPSQAASPPAPTSSAVTPPPAAEPRPPPLLVPVPGDKPVRVALAPPGVDGVIVYFHGVCGDAEAFRAFERAALRFGTLISLSGDERCDTPGRFRWGLDVRNQRKRIGAAMDAVSLLRGAPLDRSRVVLVGYSQGALRVEALGVAYPEEFPRLVAIAGPRAPHLDGFRKSHSIALVGGAWDLRSHLQEGAAKLVHRGLRAEYTELPGARHGQYGPEAERVLGEVFTWLYAAPAP